MNQSSLDPGVHTVCVVNNKLTSIISRSVIKLTGSRGNILYEGVYGGDILLRLTHFTEHRRPPEINAVTTDIIEHGKFCS